MENGINSKSDKSVVTKTTPNGGDIYPCTQDNRLFYLLKDSILIELPIQENKPITVESIWFGTRDFDTIASVDMKPQTLMVEYNNYADTNNVSIGITIALLIKVKNDANLTHFEQLINDENGQKNLIKLSISNVVQDFILEKKLSVISKLTKDDLAELGKIIKEKNNTQKTSVFDILDILHIETEMMDKKVNQELQSIKAKMKN